VENSVAIHENPNIGLQYDQQSLFGASVQRMETGP
jgi:hypothetical protein